MEQTARALNTLCRRWQERRCKQSRIEHVASVIQYHQARNKRRLKSRVCEPFRNGIASVMSKRYPDLKVRLEAPHRGGLLEFLFRDRPSGASRAR